MTGSFPYIGVLGLIIPTVIFVLGVTFQLGRHAARLYSLEEWRTNVRKDLHEVSEGMTSMNLSLAAIRTLIEERTEKQLPLHRASARVEAMELLETAKHAALEIVAEAARKATTLAAPSQGEESR